MAKSKKKTSKAKKTTSNSIDKMKYEIANEFGVNLGATASSRDNGKVGGEITKRLVEKSINSTTSTSKKQSKTSKRSKKKSK